MRNLKTLILNKKIFAIFIAVILLLSCDRKDKRNEVIIARVNDSVLTEDYLNSYLGEQSSITKYRNEFIRQWVETEALSQTAIEHDLLNHENYFKVLDKSRKELAANIAIQNYLSAKPIAAQDNVLIDYFKKNKDDYIFMEDGFVINTASFTDESSAISFRNSIIKSGWEKTIEIFNADTSLINFETQKTQKHSQLQSRLVNRALGKLYKGEVSLVLRTELNKFVIVQLIDKIPKNSIPKFKYIKDNVLVSYQYVKEKETARRFIDSLLSHKNVKIY